MAQHKPNPFPSTTTAHHVLERIRNYPGIEFSALEDSVTVFLLCQALISLHAVGVITQEGTNLYPVMQE